MKNKVVSNMSIDLSTSTVTLRDDGIVEITIKPNVLLTKSESLEIIAAIGEIKGNEKRSVLVIAGDCSLPDSEARPFLATPEANKYTIKIAYVIKNTAQKLMASVYLKIDKPNVPTLFFTSKEEALNWLM